MRYGDLSWAKPEVLDRVHELCAVQGHDPVEGSLLGAITIRMKAPLNPRQLSSGSAGVNEIWVCDLDDGTRAYHKPFSGLNENAGDLFGQTDAQGWVEAWQPVHEAAAWQLAKRLGSPWNVMVCPCVIREVAGRLGSLSQASQLPCKGGIPAWSPAFRAAGFFDILVGQQDRNRGNYFTDGRGGPDVSLIDHGFCFARPGDYFGGSVLTQRYSGETLLPSERAVLGGLVSSSDLFGMRRVLAGDRADALGVRAQRMLTGGVILDPGDF